MAEGPVILSSEGGGEAPLPFTIDPGQAMLLETASAQFDGAGAAGSFLPAIAVYLQSGDLLARTFVDEAVAAGDSAEVTFAPF